jgi:hypothetical protein
MQNRRRHEDLAFHPPGYGVGWPYPFAEIVFRRCHMRLLARRTFREEKARIESPWSKCRRHPPSDIEKCPGIDIRGGFL